MADQVTISTFLELRDNLSPALKRVADAIDDSFGKMPKGYAQAAKAAERAAKESDRAARAQVREQAKAAKASAAMLKQEEKAREKTDKAILKSVQNRVKEEAAIAARAAKQKAKSSAPVSAASAPDIAAGKKQNLLGTLVSADLLSNVMQKAASLASSALSTVADYVEKGVRLNYEYEKSISAISGAMYTMDISPSMRIAEVYTETVLGKLREFAAVLPGEAKEYVEVYQRTIPQALMSGMRDSEKYAEFVSKYTAVAIQRGVGAKVAATNLQIILGGTARAGTKMAQVLSAYTGKTINEINRMTRAARFDLIQKAVDRAASGMDASATKADAIFGTLRTHLEDILRMGSKPLFENAKGAAADLNKWFKSNKTAILDLSNTISEKLAFSLRGAIVLAKELAESVLSGFGEDKKVEDPKARLAELTSPEAESSLFDIAMSPALAFLKYMSRRGEIASLQDQIAKSEADAKKLEELKSHFEPKEQKFGITPEEKGRVRPTLEDIAFQAQEIIKLKKAGFFESSEKPFKEEFSDYMLHKGVTELKAQKIYERLIAEGAVEVSTPSEAPTDRARTYNDFRHSNFNIKQEFAEGFDPDRIAVAFSQDLARASDFKLQAAYGVTGGVH